MESRQIEETLNVILGELEILKNVVTELEKRVKVGEEWRYQLYENLGVYVSKEDLDKLLKRDLGTK